jgi:cell division protein ZapD
MEQIIYEQPLNELVRVSLRLEHILQQLDTLTTQSDSSQNTSLIIRLMTDAINILDRPDYKTKLSKEFERYITVLNPLHNDAKVDQEALNFTLTELQQYKNYFISTQGKIAQNLRINEFLTNIRQSLLIPGGDSCIDTPGYWHWLHQTGKNQKAQVNRWLNELTNIRRAISLLLGIIRKSSKPHENLAIKGFYHESLDAQLPCQLIRVALPKKTPLYPEISAGRHRFTIRFIIPSINAHPKQTDQDIRFALTKCIL